MQQVILFENKEFGEIRMLMIDGQPYFIGKDVAAALGYERPAKAILDHVDNEDKDEVPIQDSIGRMQNTPIINESGFYSLVLSSKLPTAKKFKRWVTSEVLPSIRKTGGYINGAGMEEIIQRTVTETIQAVVPEVMKAVMNNMVPFLLGQQKAVTAVKRAEKESEYLENEKDYYTYETDVAFHLMGINKIELFPEEMLEQVNGIMEGMRREQKLNCNLIARFCKNLGYPVSKETVKEYFEKKFLKG